jgi:hypothetical protein
VYLQLVSYYTPYLWDVGALQGASPDLNMLRADVAALLASYAKDNSTIYYASVPAEPEPLPEPLVSERYCERLLLDLLVLVSPMWPVSAVSLAR